MLFKPQQRPVYRLETAALYLFWLDGKWMIGPIPGVDKGVVYAADDALLPTEVEAEAWQAWSGQARAWATVVLGVGAPAGHLGSVEAP